MAANPQFSIKGDLESLKSRLKKGMIIKSRIVYCLGNNHYLLRIFGYNLIMESAVNFERFDEIVITVKKKYPKLVLSLAPEGKDSENLDIFI